VTNSTNTVESVFFTVSGESGNMAKKRLVLIGDIVLSRYISNRVSFNRQLLKTLGNLSKSNPNLLSPYTITIGEEIQAVYKNADGIFRDAITILAAIYPQKMRFSFGVGELTTPINRDQALGMDGPAFHFAREGIEKLKKTGELFLFSGDSLFALSISPPVLTLISHNMAKWKPTRLNTLSLLLNGENIKEVARKLKISLNTVYKTVDAGDLGSIMMIFSECERQLAKILSGGT
jgi:hypothetical protein